MNLYILIAFITASFSFSLIIFSLYNRPFREATGSFTLLSVVVFLNSVYIIFTLSSDSSQNSLTWAYFMEITTLVFPLLFFDFVNRFVDNRLSRIKLIYRLAFLILPLGIFIYLLTGGMIEVKKYSFGYIPYYDEQVLIGVFYLVPIYLLINIILFNRIYKNYKESKYNRNIIIIACGFLAFLVINVVYRPLGLTGAIRVIPVSSILNLALFLFIAIALLNSRFNIKNITLRRVFENVNDCIVITDSEGKIIQINRCLFKKIFPEKEMPLFTGRDNLIKETLLSYAKSSKDFKKFLIKLEDSRVKNFRTDLNFIINKTEKIFDTIISPVNDRGGNLIGKITIFRDVTSNRFYQEELRNQSWVDYLTGLTTQGIFLRDWARK
jgi:PAS domain-containing protein